MPIASASRLLARRPGNQNDSGAIWALARTFPENCMTLHDAEARPNLHFLSSPATLGESQKSLVFPHILPMKTGLWLGAESNRRHVDFQSTALPTELPSRRGCRSCVRIPARLVTKAENAGRSTRMARLSPPCRSSGAVGKDAVTEICAAIRLPCV